MFGIHFYDYNLDDTVLLKSGTIGMIIKREHGYFHDDYLIKTTDDLYVKERGEEIVCKLNDKQKIFLLNQQRKYIDMVDECKSICKRYMNNSIQTTNSLCERLCKLENKFEEDGSKND